MNARRMATAAVCALMFCACKPPAKLSADVPGDWKVAEKSAGDGFQNLFLTPVGRESDASIGVVCGSVRKFHPKDVLNKVVSGIPDEGGEFLAAIADPDGVTMRVYYALTIEAAEGKKTPYIGRAVIKPDSGGRGMTVLVVGLWAAMNDDRYASVFDGVAASADCR